MTVTDTGSVIHHPRLRRSAGVSVGGLDRFCDVPRDAILHGILCRRCKSIDSSRDTSGADGDIEKETE